MMKYPPGPKINIPAALIAQFLPNSQFNLLEFVTYSLKTFGDIVFWNFGPTKIYLFNHPDYVREIAVEKADKFHKPRLARNVLGTFLGNGLLLSDGDFWKRQRKLAQPAFHAKRIESYAQTMVEHTQRMLNRWQSGETRNVDDDMMALTLGIVAKTLFNADVSASTEGVGAALDEFQKIANQKFMSLIQLPYWLPTPQHLREQKLVRFVDSVLMDVINQRRASKEDTGDLLSMLLLACDDNGGQMTDQQLRDEVTTVFLAGYETTSNALIWTWYLLSQNPDAEAKLIDELNRVLAGRAPTVDDLPNMPYTEMVIKEAMRIYPPAYNISREPVEDVTIGGYEIKKGSLITIYMYALHRDPRFFPDPEAFIPERFSKENEVKIPRLAYMPFGAGPRICIGNMFSMMEARLLLATIAQRYQMRLAPGQKVEPEALITLHPKYGMNMVITERESVKQPVKEMAQFISGPGKTRPAQTR